MWKKHLKENANFYPIQLMHGKATATPHTEGGKKEGIYHGAELHVTKIRRNRESEKRSAVITQYQHHQRAKHYTGNDVKTEV